MKIAVNARLLLANKLEGIGWFTHELLSRLVQRRPNDEFIFYFDRPYAPEFIFAPNVKPVVLFPPARHPLLYLWWFNLSLTRSLQREKPAIFFSPEALAPIAPPCPSVVTIHDLAISHFPEQVSYSERLYHRFILPKIVARAAGILTVSDFSKNDIKYIFNTNASKIDVTNNACRKNIRPLDEAEKKIARQRYANGTDYFLYVGALHPRKNIPRLLLAFDVLKTATKSPIKLIICGKKAWKTTAIEEIYRKMTHKIDVIFLGYVPEQELPLLLGGAFSFCYLSLFEGFGMPVLEAMTADVPVLASNIPPIFEVVNDAALLVNPFDIQEISRNMQQLLENNTLREYLINKGRHQRTYFTWERATDVVEACLLKHCR